VVGFWAGPNDQLVTFAMTILVELMTEEEYEIMGEQARDTIAKDDWEWEIIHATKLCSFILPWHIWLVKCEVWTSTKGQLLLFYYGTARKAIVQILFGPCMMARLGIWFRPF
jgi:hypothetical protein